MKGLGTLIAASLEDANVKMPEPDVADIVAEVVAQQTGEVSPVVEAMQNGAEVGDVVDVIGQIAEVAEIVPEADETIAPTVTVESLQSNLALVLRSHGQRGVTASSFEAKDGTDGRAALAAQARSIALAMQGGRVASLESAIGDIRNRLTGEADLIKKAGTVLAKIQADLKANGALVQGKALTYQGIYNFLNVDGTPRFDIANVLKEEKVKMQGLVGLLKWFEDAYKGISLDRESDPEKALDVLTRCISTLDYTNELVKFDDTKLLNNGRLFLEESFDRPVLDIVYETPKGDGSKATIGSRVLNSLIPAGIGGVFGGIAGRTAGGAIGYMAGGFKGMATGANVGTAVGAGTGIYFGTKKGISKADAKVAGKETQTELTVDDVIEFVKAAQELTGLVDKVKAQLIVADQGDTQIRNYLKTLHANMKKDDRWKVGAAKVAGVLATALLVGAAGAAGGRYNGPVIGAGVQTHADEIIGNAQNLVGAVYAANCSVADVLVTHVLNCVKGAIGVGAALLGEDPVKAVK